ncbi:helix-turn-helix domain-containing protein, partial [Sporofaciens sp. SGI.106]|uniref:helix-turn-helix domain-containing protein n=1 Tax=Sporofaciens sp. SGI.106 TaxID=3420568 RepID=UPI003D0678C4
QDAIIFKNFRSRYHMRQVDIADALGIHVSTVRKIETGNLKISNSVSRKMKDFTKRNLIDINNIELQTIIKDTYLIDDDDNTLLEVCDHISKDLLTILDNFDDLHYTIKSEYLHFVSRLINDVAELCTSKQIQLQSTSYSRRYIDRGADELADHVKTHETKSEDNIKSITEENKIRKEKNSLL